MPWTKKFLIVGAIACLLPACGDLIVVRDRAAVAQGAKRALPPLSLEDFEGGAQGYGYGDKEAGGSAEISTETRDVHQGAKALRCEYRSGSQGWGAGFDVEVASLPKAGYFNFDGYRGIGFWAKLPAGTNAFLQLGEAKSGLGQGENYLAQDFTGTGRWKQYYFAFDGFARNPYTGNQGGNGVLDLAAIRTLSFSIRERQGADVFFLDQLYCR